MGYWRHVKTTKEKRDWGRFLYELNTFPILKGIVKIRYRRSTKRLMSFWDECDKSNWRDRSWKRYRLTQYKTKNIN